MAYGAGMARHVNGMISRYGETMTLARETEATAITLKGKRIGGALDAVGNTDQQQFRVKIGTGEINASAWSVKEPRAGGLAAVAGDTLTVNDRVCNVLDVRPLRVGEVVAMYELEVAG